MIIICICLQSALVRWVFLARLQNALVLRLLIVTSCDQTGSIDVSASAALNRLLIAKV